MSMKKLFEKGALKFPKNKYKPLKMSMKELISVQSSPPVFNIGKEELLHRNFKSTLPTYLEHTF